MKKFILLLFALLAMAVTAQAKTVTGVVVSADDDEPLAGATIMPVGGGTGVSTDVDGKFSFTVPGTCKQIRVSYVGMITQTVKLTGEDLVVKLESSNLKLDEVMVVAYGTAKKLAYTGSAAVLNAEEIGQAQVSNAMNALDGKVAGLQLTNTSGQPGSTTPAIRIRGISSINAGNEPLVVVDGAPFSGDVNTISAQDIESMTVLKDAASNSLYGARGANGVILITTKKGSSLNGATVTLDMKWGANSRASQLYKNLTDPAAYYEAYYSSLYNYATTAQNMDAAGAHAWANNNLTAQNAQGLGYNVYTVPEGQYLIGTNGRLNPLATMGRTVNYNGMDYYLTADDWMDAAYRTSLRQEYNLSVSNSNDRTNFYLSASYLNNEGITPNSGYERLTGRLTADTQAKSWLKVGGNLSYTHYRGKEMGEDGVSNSSGNIFAAATQMAPIYPLYLRDGNGKIMVDANGITRYDYGDRENAGLERPIYTASNAVSSALYDVNKHNGNAMQGLGFFEIRLKDFKFTSNNSINFDEARWTYVTNPYYGSYASSNGIVSKYHSRTLGYNLQQLLNWNHSFNGHDVELLLGHEYYRTRYYSLSGSKSNMFDPSNDELDGAVTDGSQGSYTTDYNTEGFFGRAQYSFGDRYFGSFSFRRDGSSRFHPNHRWGSFWSFGAAWNISKESWFTADIFDLLKIKASYGEQGNDNINDFLYTNYSSIVNGVGNPAVSPGSMGNPNITWEKGGNFNAGAEWEMWNGRFNGSAEFFYRLTSDMLFYFPLPTSFGYGGYYTNIGDMSNVGIELDLSGDVIATRDFTWSLNFNLTWYKNKITSLPDERKPTTVDGVSGFQSGEFFYGEGKPIYNYYTKKYAGVNDKGEALYYRNVKDGNGNITGVETTTNYNDASRYLCGTVLPDVYGGFGTSINFKGIDFAINFAYQLGGQVYDGDYAAAMTPPTSTQRGSAIHADYLKSWSPSNPNSDIPRWQYNDLYTTASSDRFLTSASYLSLQNINLGYTLPASINRALNIQRLRVYLACENVWLWSKRQGLDPRQSFTGATTSSYYSPIRTISGGLTLSF